MLVRCHPLDPRQGVLFEEGIWSELANATEGTNISKRAA